MRRIARLACVLGVLLGLGVVCLPFVSDLMAARRAEEVITTLEDKLDVSHDPARLGWLEQARAYNDRLAGLGYQEPEGGILPYDDQLSWRGKPYMAWCHIPSIGLKMPVYHGTADEELAMGLGHLEGRSLPVGGEAAMCVLEGHSGMPESRMLDDIRELEIGEKACVWTLSEPYSYQVAKWLIVDPEEVADVCAVPESGDMLAFVTCTTSPDAAHPRGKVGVNDKRLVILCERCEYDPADFAEHEGVEAVAQAVGSSRARPVIAAGAFLLVAAAFAAGTRAGKRRVGV